MPGENNEERCYNWRKSLPAPMVSKGDVGIWSILKHSIGRDLTRISIPIFFNEPLSFLQRLAEYMDYSELLKKADQCEDPILRFEYVAAFIVSTLSFNHLRLAKPFNPLWFETFELDRKEYEGYRFVAEQVSHHPPVSAFHAHSDFYEFYGTVSPRLKFWGSSIEVLPGGSFVLTFLRRNEVYTWNALNVSVHNVVMGEMCMNLEGELLIRCSSGDEFQIKIRQAGGASPSSNAFLEGRLTRLGKTIRAAYGNWTRFFATCDKRNFAENFREWIDKHKLFFVDDNTKASLPLIEGTRLLWRVRARQADSKNMYNYTLFTLLLNDHKFINDSLPRTDSRLRPDIRLLELGKIDEAAKEKERLEIKQREARAIQKKMKIEKLPKWFESQKTKDGPTWLFNWKYWDRDFSDCEDIF